MSKLDPLTADPRELSNALRRECLKMASNKAWPHYAGLAAALLAVLDECEKPINTKNEPAYQIGVEDAKWSILRAAAAAWVANGGSLELEDE